jgi:serine/threonine protein kinase
LRHCHSEYIVKYYGAYIDVTDQFLYLFTEFCDVGSFQHIGNMVKSKGQVFPEWILQNVATSVIHGLVYLYKELRMIHRDIKPSNILMNGKGEIKLCDLGVSKELSSASNADTFVGTSFYMSPERIRGMSHSSQGDVWSLGISLYELAEGKLPYSPNMSILELLQCIVCDPLPHLSSSWSASFQEFLNMW